MKKGRKYINKNGVNKVIDLSELDKWLSEGWEKYIVDTKTNRSHFGKNNEYVLVVPNNRNL